MLPTSTIPGYDQVFAEEYPQATQLEVACNITTTDNKHNHTFQIRYSNDEYVMRAPVSRRGYNTFLIIFGAFMTANIFASTAKNAYFYLLTIPFAVAGLAIEKKVRRRQNKSFTKEIVINRSGITLDGLQYSWNEMINTFMVERYRFRYCEIYLVLALKSGSNVYVHLSQSDLVDQDKDKVATAITHFKPAV